MRIGWNLVFVVLGLVCLPFRAMPAGDAAKPLTVELSSFTFKVPEAKASLFGYNREEEKLFFYTNGTATATVKVPKDGAYEITLKASEDRALKEGAKFKVAVDGKQVGKETELPADVTKDFHFSTTLKTGEHKLSIEFTNDVYKDGEYDRNFYVHAVTLTKVK